MYIVETNTCYMDVGGDINHDSRGQGLHQPRGEAECLVKAWASAGVVNIFTNIHVAGVSVYSTIQSVYIL